MHMFGFHCHQDASEICQGVEIRNVSFGFLGPVRKFSSSVDEDSEVGENECCNLA